ncbi:MAG: MATE family efflux transporter [Tannerella sp.]|jgi:putative MATE family efflux protein|nr:MATE family efflux transporter [Tannerella sp.]
MSQQNIPTELGTVRVSSLLRQYAFPAIIAMIASSLYNMVDSIFIGHGVGALAITGFAITFPFMNLSAALGAMVGVGASTLVSVRLGQKDYLSAQNVLGNVVILNVIISIAFTVVAIIFLDPVLYFFGASDNTITYAREYMYIILLGNVVTHLYFGLNNVLRASGHPQKAMMLTITTVILNTVLDPIFIFGFKWGIQGAAVATVLSQIMALCWQLKLFNNKAELLHFRRSIFKWNMRIVRDMLSIGMAPFLMNAASCVIIILINNALKRYSGDLAIGAYGIINRVSFMFVMIVMGLNQGMQPIAGYNYGARLYVRVQEVLRLTIIFGTIITTTAFLVGELIPDLVVRAFTSDEELISLSVYGMRITVMFYPLIGAQIVIATFFQSIGLAGKAIFLSLIRQVIVLIPCLLILPQFFDVTGVWISLPASDIAACIVSTVMIMQQIRKFKSEIL